MSKIISKNRQSVRVSGTKWVAWTIKFLISGDVHPGGPQGRQTGPKYINCEACGRAFNQLGRRCRGLRARFLGLRSCIKILGQLLNPRYLSSPSSNGYLVHRPKVGSTVADAFRVNGAKIVR